MSSYKEEMKERVVTEINNLTKEDLENSEDSLEIILISKHQIPLINLGNIYQEENGETDVDISKDNRFEAYYGNDGRPVYKKATVIAIHLPFEGKAEFLSIQPSTFQIVSFNGHVENNEIILPFKFFPDVDKSETLKKDIDSAIEYVKKHVEWMNKDLSSFNIDIQNLIPSTLKKRKQDLESQKKIINDLGIPKKESTKTKIGFIKPIEKKSIKLLTLKETPNEFVLENAVYEDITNLINSLGINLERVNKIVRDLDEESLRDILFVALNSSFKGIVSTEAFNKSGKTDLLIRQDNKNVYVSECKIWRGDSYFNEGIEQLLNNLTWRDSKCSYIIFSKNEDFSNVLNKSIKLVQAHSLFLKKVKEVNPTSYTFEFKGKDDNQRKVSLTLHLFNLK